MATAQGTLYKFADAVTAGHLPQLGAAMAGLMGAPGTYDQRLAVAQQQAAQAEANQGIPGAVATGAGTLADMYLARGAMQGLGAAAGGIRTAAATPMVAGFPGVPALADMLPSAGSLIPKTLAGKAALAVAALTGGADYASQGPAATAKAVTQAAGNPQAAAPQAPAGSPAAEAVSQGEGYARQMRQAPQQAASDMLTAAMHQPMPLRVWMALAPTLNAAQPTVTPVQAMQSQVLPAIGAQMGDEMSAAQRLLNEGQQAQAGKQVNDAISRALERASAYTNPMGAMYAQGIPTYNNTVNPG